LARKGVLGLMLGMVAYISLVVGPIGLLVLFELQFLPFHSVKITWWHRIAVILDITLLWLMWPSISTDRASHDDDVSSTLPIIPYGGFSPVRLEGWTGKKVWLAWRKLRHARIVAALASIAIFLFVVTPATFPGELMEEILPPSLKLLHKVLIAGDSEVDPITRRPTSLWPNSNRIVLPGLVT